MSKLEDILLNSFKLRVGNKRDYSFDEIIDIVSQQQKENPHLESLNLIEEFIRNKKVKI